MNNQVLMWSHYAGSHAGLCLRFKSRPLKGDIPDLAYRVSYSSDRPVVNRATDTDNYDGLFDAMLVPAVDRRADLYDLSDANLRRTSDQPRIAATLAYRLGNFVSDRVRQLALERM